MKRLVHGHTQRDGVALRDGSALWKSLGGLSVSFTEILARGMVLAAVATMYVSEGNNTRLAFKNQDGRVYTVQFPNAMRSFIRRAVRNLRQNCDDLTG